MDWSADMFESECDGREKKISFRRNQEERKEKETGNLFNTSVDSTLSEVFPSTL